MKALNAKIVLRKITKKQTRPLDTLEQEDELSTTLF